jgi:hypothetical protein
VGFSDIRQIKFAAGGWGQEANDKNVNTIDQISISMSAATEQRRAAGRRQTPAPAPVPEASIVVINHPFPKDTADELLATFAMVCCCVCGLIEISSCLTMSGAARCVTCRTRRGSTLPSLC